MTPSLARMVADKYQQLRFPLRWFSIPNCFRYEAPQKGRLREFWQLNADIIGAEAGAVDLEILVTTAKLFLSFGADKKMFKIIFNHRKVIDLWLEKYNLIDRKTLIYAVLDDWYKFSIEVNSEKLKTELNENEIQNLINLCAKEKQEWQDYLEIANSFEEIKLTLEILPQILPEVEFEFSPTIIRGLAYYTGLVFEGFNKNPKSPRAMFGAGRYDNLLELFNKPQTPAVGVGVGDVTWLDFLKEWNLLDGNESFENWKKANIKEKVGIMVMREENKNKVLSQNEIEKLEVILGKLG
jgi:histidyl-tRNA synthetase